MNSGAIVGLVAGLTIFFIVAAIIVAVVVVTTLPPYVHISAYTAEIKYDYDHGHYVNARKVTLSSHEFWSEFAYDESTYFSRSFSNADDNTISICDRYGDHNSCYKRSAKIVGDFYVYRDMTKSKSNVDCPKISDPVLAGSKKRTLKKCDMYEYFSSNLYEKDWVEHDTGYPVITHQLVYDTNGQISTNITLQYTSFDGSVPTNRTGLNPPANTKVYDFRDGHIESSSGFLSQISDWVKSFFSHDFVEPNLAADATMLRFKIQQAVEERTNMILPSFAFGSGLGKTPERMKLRRDVSIPESFDARENWASCSNIIGGITNQKTCGSCWAMSTAAVLSDRACINNISSVAYSPQYMMSCYPHQLSCNGGYGSTVWMDVHEFGTVPESCYPFVAKDTSCPTHCTNGALITDQMRLKTSRFYSPWAESESDRVKAIQMDIMENGPVGVAMLTFSDFQWMSRGAIYRRTRSAQFSGGHMVRIIGWGKEGNQDYWLVANSWGTTWGEKGFFKIARGTNECNIENTVVAGLFN